MSYINAIRKQDRVIVWSRTDHDERIETEYPAPWYFYTENKKGDHTSIYGHKLIKHEFTNGKDFYQAKDAYKRKSVRVFESDISPELRLLSNLFHDQPPCPINVTMLDIEVDYDPEVGFSSVANPYAPINSISLFHEHTNTMVAIAVPPPTWEHGMDVQRVIDEMNKIQPIPTEYALRVHLVSSEAQLLRMVLKEIENSDVACGWNSDFFDMPYIAKRVERVLGKASFKKLCFPGCKEPMFDEVPNKWGGTNIIVRLSGRVSLDYMRLYQKFEPGERYSFSLDAIEQEVNLGLPKMKYTGSLASLYRDNFPFFVRYNIRDCEILHGFEHKLGYVNVSNILCHLSTGLLDHILGTIKLAELAIINYAHHKLGLVVNDTTPGGEDRSIAGAFVLFPQKGMHQLLASVDINSLYPSAIRSVNISMETLRGQFADTTRAVDLISRGTPVDLVLDLENGESVTKPANEWKHWLQERKWAISGYGTVFDQSEQGIIPMILSDWYTTRKHYQKLKAQASDELNHEMVGYYDRLQYVFKIKLNSLYGALTNLYFRFFDLRMGESTTSTGRKILMHQCRMVSKLLDGKYDIEIPMYETTTEALKKGYSAQEALDGPVFNGQFQSESVIYGDTDSVDKDTIVDIDGERDTVHNHFERLADVAQVIKAPNDVELLMLHGAYDTPCIADEGWDYTPVKLMYRHKSNKRRFKVTTSSGREVIVTEDHSLIRINENSVLESCTPLALQIGDRVIEQK